MPIHCICPSDILSRNTQAAKSHLLRSYGLIPRHRCHRWLGAFMEPQEI